MHTNEKHAFTFSDFVIRRSKWWRPNRFYGLFQVGGRRSLFSRFWLALVSSKLVTVHEPFDVLRTKMRAKLVGLPSYHATPSKSSSCDTTIKHGFSRKVYRSRLFPSSTVFLNVSIFFAMVVKVPLCVRIIVKTLLCISAETTSSDGWSQARRILS